MGTTTLDTILDVDPEQTRTPDTLEGEVVGGEMVSLPESGTLAPIPGAASEDPRLVSDFEFTREAMRDIITKGRQAADSAIVLAQAGDEPRPYEVVGTLIASLVSANKELMRLHRTRRDVLQPYPSDVPSTPAAAGGGSVLIDKAVFVGRASDLLREIRQIAKSTKEGDNTNG